ncbi:hypothetical protein [Nonomuraea rubra]|uniref:Uncharacterized protein n=1 Tax=Nonomuraea rubra TaxID=46180 RepID=A0A7X0P804_9ACTN|nr:hypothetical protein [Nonomuraea rubra]MBB6556988.1 hypothetical protein [Nonomuraea rubra]
MLTVAVIATAICTAIPVAIFIRMVVTGPRVRAEIHTAFQTRPTSTQGATSSAKTPVAPRNPARRYAHEVVSS